VHGATRRLLPTREPKTADSSVFAPRERALDVSRVSDGEPTPARYSAWLARSFFASAMIAWATWAGTSS
jgi:hypothetical protein